jgi:hypothetical protein
MISSVIAAALCAMAAVAADAAGRDRQQPQPAMPQVARVFLDCDPCDEDYLRKEVTFVDYVRNREDADVHLLVTTQDTGAGGRQWTLKFIGLRAYLGVEHTLVYNEAPTATEDETRAGFARVFRLGLVRYVATTGVADRLRVTFEQPEGVQPAATTPEKDPWNFWVFEIEAGGDFNGEEQQSGRSVRGSVEANRTTDAWRFGFDAGANYSDDKFLLDDEDEEDGEGGGGRSRTVLSVRRDLNASAIVVKSLTRHWSLGLMGDAQSQTFRNYALRTRVAPGVEYNIFPYSESTRRMLTVQYTVGHDYHRYIEETIFGKVNEQLLDHRAAIELSLQQPWGESNAELNFNQYLTDPSKYSIGFEGGAEIRLFKGFSVDFSGEFSRTRDQIYLPRGGATNEEILLRQRQLATGYQYFVNFGISYTFGSIFNNIVNPRFGGS